MKRNFLFAAFLVVISPLFVPAQNDKTNDEQIAVTRKHIQYISLLKINGEWKMVGILMPPLSFAETASK